jgi:hypothetical protein
MHAGMQLLMLPAQSPSRLEIPAAERTGAWTLEIILQLLHIKPYTHSREHTSIYAEFQFQGICVCIRRGIASVVVSVRCCV